MFYLIHVFMNQIEQPNFLGVECNKNSRFFERIKILCKVLLNTLKENRNLFGIR